MIEIIQTPIENLLIIKPNKLLDDRGFFTELWNHKTWSEINLPTNFVQDNLAKSSKGVLRGLHFQNPPFAQAKLVTVLSGSVLDVVVDLRKNSKTFGKHYSIELSGKDITWFYIPEGFAHGYSVLEDDTVFYYKCSDFYNPEAENGINWKSLEIDWKNNNPIVSLKDDNYHSFDNFNTPFL